MAKLRINGDSSGYVDLSAPNASSSRTIDVDQLPELNVANTFTTHQVIRTDTASGGYTVYPSLTLRNDNVNGYSVLHFNRGATTQSARIEVDNNNGSPTISMYATSAGNGIKVDHNGAVTMSNQPVFMARKSSSQNIVNADKITFENAIVNAGTHYNTTNSRFTAPVAGNYSFSINLRCGIESGARVLTTAIYKNGSELYGRFAGAGGVNDWGSGSYDHPYISGTIILPLNANDYIEIYFGTENSYSGNGFIQNSANSSYFMGHLIG